MNVFDHARTKLTIYYLAIIMAISLFFSVIIYQGATSELARIENRQKAIRPNPMFVIAPEIVEETKSRIFFSLLTLNLIILGVSGLSGYFLSGKTLEPISKMIDEQKNFVSNASHELRTPLSSLKTEIEVFLREKKVNLKDAKTLINSNLDDVNNMVKLSNYLLRLNKFQNGMSDIKFEKVGLSEVCKKAIGKNNVNLTEDQSIVKGNFDSLVELVTILIENAIKYGNGKPVEVSVLKKQIVIKDHGIGISSGDLPHIFERFYRGNKARGKDGYGLGLSIAKQIVELHNAEIKVKSKLGIGSTFKVIFS